MRNELFDEALDVLERRRGPVEPFSYEGRHFEARNVVQRPRPAQQPIPVWIGGNSRLSRRRVAARAQGWMPMGGPPELASTTRTPHVGSLDTLTGMIAEVKALAGGRAASLDFVAQYQDPALGVDAGHDARRHRDAFAGYAAAGTTWLVVGATSPTPDRHRAFIETFGET